MNHFEAGHDLEPQGVRADEALTREAYRIMAARGDLNFSQALNLAMSANPTLAESYRAYTVEQHYGRDSAEFRALARS